MSYLQTVALALVLTATACGGSDSDPSPSPGPGTSGTGGTVTATIDGVPFTSGVSVTSSITAAGVFGFGASNANGSITFTAAGPAAVGTTSIPTFPTNAIMLISSQSWVANSSQGGSGTLRISTFTATSATGTFEFTLVPVTGSGATGNKVVTNGVFSVTF